MKPYKQIKKVSYSDYYQLLVAAARAVESLVANAPHERCVKRKGEEILKVILDYKQEVEGRLADAQKREKGLSTVGWAFELSAIAEILQLIGE